jgi:hypothetical protein
MPHRGFPCSPVADERNNHVINFLAQ